MHNEKKDKSANKAGKEKSDKNGNVNAIMKARGEKNSK